MTHGDGECGFIAFRLRLSSPLPPVMPRCTVRHLAKHYGTLTALHEATLTVHDGEVLGLLGPNGAGKTTLMACLAGLQPPDAGTITFDHDAAWDASARSASTSPVFYLPDGITPWGAQRVGWLMDFMAGVMGRAAHGVADVREVLQIAPLTDRRLDTLSKGQRKRVLLALALLVPQPLLLLDEPFDGLDLRLTREVVALLRRQAAAGRALVVSLHAMPDAERVCDRVVLLDNGRTVAEGSIAALREATGLPNAPLEEVFLAYV